MLKFRIIASVIPLLAVTGLAGSWALPAIQPCLATPEAAISFSTLPWRADAHVAFTEKATEASVRVQLVERVDLADFVVADDVSLIASEASACHAGLAARTVTIDRTPGRDDILIHLTTSDDADYRIFVSSRTFTAREAAAMIVAAHRLSATHASQL